VRFSSVFQQPVPVPSPRPAEALREVSPELPAAPAAELPDELDARVRLIGEWQLGEG
jgi:hypothetical protein